MTCYSKENCKYFTILNINVSLSMKPWQNDNMYSEKIIWDNYSKYLMSVDAPVTKILFSYNWVFVYFSSVCIYKDKWGKKNSINFRRKTFCKCLCVYVLELNKSHYNIPPYTTHISFYRSLIHSENNTNQLSSAFSMSSLALYVKSVCRRN